MHKLGTILILLIPHVSIVSAEEWKIVYLQRFQIEKSVIENISYDGNKITLKLRNEIGMPMLNDQKVEVNKEKTYDMKIDDDLTFVHRHGYTEFKKSKQQGLENGFCIEFITYFNANSFGGPETTETWPIFIKRVGNK